MSKYTTEVRFICETQAGLTESTGADNVDDVLDKSWAKIFTSPVKFFEEEYRPVLCKKILKHYYTREISAETVGLWRLWMNTRLEEIMPYYNQLYESAKLEISPLEDVNLTRTHKRTSEDTTKETTTDTQTTNGTRASNGTGTNESTNTGTNNSTVTSNNTNKNLYSDTPQGAITGLESETYLTNARKVTDTGTDTTKGDTSNTIMGKTGYDDSETTQSTLDGTKTASGTVSGTEDFSETVKGKQGSGSFSKMLEEYRDTFLNIDMQVIDEFSDLFFGLW